MKISDLISILSDLEDLEVYTHWEGTFHEVNPENVYVALRENIGSSSLYFDLIEMDHGPEKGRILIIDADLHESDKAVYKA